MKKIFCKTEAKGIQSFYLFVDGKTYYLFSQNYRISNKMMFGNGGISLEKALDISAAKGVANQKTIAKLIPAIRYIEKEYEFKALKQSIEKTREKAPYKRQRINYTNLLFDEYGEVL